MRYLIISIFLNVLLLAVHAEEPVVAKHAEDPVVAKDESILEITISEQDVTQLKRTVAWAGEQLKNTCNTFQTDLNQLQEMFDAVLFTEEATPEMFEESIQKRQNINFQLEQIRATRQHVKGVAEERYEKLVLWSETFEELKTTPDEELTEVQKQFIPNLEKGIVLMAEAIYLTEQYLRILAEQSGLFIEQTILATRVHSLSQESRGKLLIKERERALASIKATLLSEEEKMLKKTRGYSKSTSGIRSGSSHCQHDKSFTR